MLALITLHPNYFRRLKKILSQLHMFLIVAAKNCRRSTDTSHDYIGVGYSYLHSAEYSSRINSTLSTNMDVFVGSDQHSLPVFVHIGNYTRGSSFHRMFSRTASSLRLDHHILILVLIVIKLAKVRKLKSALGE